MASQVLRRGIWHPPERPRFWHDKVPPPSPIRLVNHPTFCLWAGPKICLKRGASYPDTLCHTHSRVGFALSPDLNLTERIESVLYVIQHMVCVLQGGRDTLIGFAICSCHSNDDADTTSVGTLGVAVVNVLSPVLPQSHWGLQFAVKCQTITFINSYCVALNTLNALPLSPFRLAIPTSPTRPEST